MTLSIRDPETDRLARELAVRYGRPITEVIKVALKDLAAKPAPSDLAEREKRLKALFVLIHARKIPAGPTAKELMDDLYDEDGLPA